MQYAGSNFTRGILAGTGFVARDASERLKEEVTVRLKGD